MTGEGAGLTLGGMGLGLAGVELEFSPLMLPGLWEELTGSQGRDV